MSEFEDILQILAEWRKVLDEVIAEVRRNPDFAEWITPVVLGSKTATERAQIYQALPDLFAIFGERGEQELRTYLEALELATLRLIVRSYALDPGKRTTRWRERAKLTDFITERVIQRIQQ